MCLSGEPYSQDFHCWSSKSNVPKKLYSKCNRAKSTTLGLLAGSKMASQSKHCTNIEHCMQKPTTLPYRYSMGAIRSQVLYRLHGPPVTVSQDGKSRRDHCQACGMLYAWFIIFWVEGNLVQSYIDYCGRNFVLSEHWGQPNVLDVLQVLRVTPRPDDVQVR